MRYFSRIRPQPGRTADPAVWRTIADGYRLKQTVWNFFPSSPDHERDFLFRFDHSPKGPQLYLLSARNPIDSTGRWRIDTKEYRPLLKRGYRLFFNLRANPVITKKREDGRCVRHDVVMEAKHVIKGGKSKALPSQAELVARAGSRWLVDRAEKHGFTIEREDLRTDKYTQHDLEKPGTGRPIHLSTLDFEGLLTVTDTERFRNVLFNGLGPAKGFGCGLLLVARV